MHARFLTAGTGTLTTHERFHLVLLRSRPDTVRRFSLHKTRTCTKRTATYTSCKVARIIYLFLLNIASYIE